MTLPTGWAHKGSEIEEWVDLRFFRPLGRILVRWVAPTRVSADQLTVASLVLGLAAGHLFVYESRALNLLGLLLFLVSDVFDSADGQLARLRGVSTRWGRVLDGLSDNARFVNLYAHLLVRLILSHPLTPLGAVVLVLGAGFSHSLQAGVADYIRQVYLYLTAGNGELDLPEDVTWQAGSWLTRFARSTYRAYVTRQARWCARSAALVRAVRVHGVTPQLGAEWREHQGRTVRRAAWIAQNVRFGLLAVTACVGWPQGFLWLTVLPLNLVLLGILWSHERTAARLEAQVVLESDLVPAGTG